MIGGERALDPRQVTVWRLGYGIPAAVVVAVLVVAEALARAAADDDVPGPPFLVPGVVAVVSATIAWRVPRLAYERWRYELAETSLVLRRGVVVRTTTAVPYFRIQHIDVTRSPFERALGLSQLVVRTAAATTDATLPGVAAADADALRDVLLARTGGGIDV